MREPYEGTAWTYGDHVDTDVIIPARYLVSSTPSELAPHCMEDIDKTFAQSVKSGDVIVAGVNFGCGSSREHAPLAILGAGVSCVIAKSFGRIFFRNSINVGLPIVECEESGRISKGDSLKVDLSKGEILNVTKNETYKVQPFPKFLEDLVELGGLVPYVKARIGEQAATGPCCCESAKHTSGTYNLSCVPGDGIGPEVTREARKVMDAAAAAFGFKLSWTDYPYGAGHYLKTGEILPEEGIEAVGKSDAMLLGAIGDPRVKPGVLEHGILLTLRFRFDQYVNLRPAMSFPKVPMPVALSGSRLDTVVVRENTEDLYMGIGGSSDGGSMSFPVEASRGEYELKGCFSAWTTPSLPMAAQVALATRTGVARITKYACDLAVKRGEDKITLITKSNAVPHIYGFFEEEAARVLADYRGMKMEKHNVDAACYHLVRRPDMYGVVLCPNLFGDIISDLMAGLAGGLGTAAGGNIGLGLSMFEPVHGSAPDIAGTGKSNPIAAILSGAMLLSHIGQDDAGKAIEDAVYRYLDESTPDELPYEFGGKRPVDAVGDEVAKRVKK